MGGGRGQWRDVGAEQPHLVVPKNGVGLFQVAARGTQCLDFPASQRDARLDLVFDEIVEARLAVFDDKAAAGAFGRLAGFGCCHG
jgi:hypothetical protein